jgi:hypothetical protein
MAWTPAEASRRLQARDWATVAKASRRLQGAIGRGFAAPSSSRPRRVRDVGDGHQHRQRLRGGHKRLPAEASRRLQARDDCGRFVCRQESFPAEASRRLQARDSAYRGASRVSLGPAEASRRLQARDTCRNCERTLASVPAEASRRLQARDAESSAARRTAPRPAEASRRLQARDRAGRVSPFLSSSRQRLRGAFKLATTLEFAARPVSSGRQRLRGAFKLATPRPGPNLSGIRDPAEASRRLQARDLDPLRRTRLGRQPAEASRRLQARDAREWVRHILPA